MPIFKKEHLESFSPTASFEVSAAKDGGYILLQPPTVGGFRKCFTAWGELVQFLCEAGAHHFHGNGTELWRRTDDPTPGEP